MTPAAWRSVACIAGGICAVLCLLFWGTRAGAVFAGLALLCGVPEWRMRTRRRR